MLKTCFKELRFHTRLFLLYSSIIIILLLLVFFSFYYYILKDTESKATDNLSILAMDAVKQMDHSFELMTKLSLQVATNPQLINTFSSIQMIKPLQTKYFSDPANSNYFDYNLELENDLCKILTSINGADFSTSRIFVFDPLGDYIYTGIREAQPSLIYDFIGSQTYKYLYTKLNDGVTQYIITPPAKDILSNRNDVYFSLFRVLKNPSVNSQNFATVIIQQPYKIITDIATSIKIEGLNVYIFSDKGEVIFSPKNKSNQFDSFYFNETATSTKSLVKVQSPYDKKTQLLSYSTSQISGWTVVLAQSQENLISSATFLGRLLLVFGSVLLLTSLVLGYIITNQLTKPLKQLQKSVSNVTLQNLAIEIPHSSTHNDIIQLNAAFEAMFQRIEDSMVQIVQLRSQELKAHLLALQSQMSPHFLYNVLALISSASTNSSSIQVMEMCHKLSNMLRYTTSYKQTIVTIRDELSHTNCYLEFMKEWHMEKLVVKTSVSEDILNISIPKLILQPLVENCFQHGFESMRPPWEIAIVIDATHDMWKIELADNGEGVSDTFIEGFYKKAQDLLKDSSKLNAMSLGGMGLLNTYLRLKLLYDNNMVFDMKNIMPHGFKITLGGKL